MLRNNTVNVEHMSIQQIHVFTTQSSLQVIRTVERIQQIHVFTTQSSLQVIALWSTYNKNTSLQRKALCG